jgi:DNA-binding HxlR family transcriptional regulator
MAREPRRSGCPIAISLDLFGDRWSLLIVRDLLFADRCTFKEFAGADERIATNILADRLGRLEGAGIVERRADPADGRKVVYVLTDKGFDLAPVILEMALWAAKHEDTDAPPAMVSALRRDRARVLRELRARRRRA